MRATFLESAAAEAIAAAERLNRRWIGIDVTQSPSPSSATACATLRRGTYDVLGDPDLPSAAALASTNQFEWWTLGLWTFGTNARAPIPFISFFDDASGKAKRVACRSRAATCSATRSPPSRATEREKQIGLFITLEPPTAPMRSEAAAAGFYEPSHFLDHRFPRVQILTIEELLSGAQAQYPRFAPEATFRRAPRRQRQQREQKRMI